MVKYVNDFVAFNDQVTSRIESYDFGVVGRQIYESRLQGIIGVRNDSTFIQALQRANAVSSRSYSFFWGSEMMDDSRHGSVTFGGYDESIIKGDQKVTKSFNLTESACVEGMIVELTKMRLFNETGTVADVFDGQDVNIFDGLGPMQVCVVPSMRNIMALPKAYGDRIIRVTPQKARATFRGNLSITIEDTITVNFTAEQLMLEETFYDSNGFIQRNTSLTNIPLVVEDPL
ncbi:hypothetical protein N0V91_004477 [Didymella pomorum]|uniref:Peptidase A1 domain-containing protein n=1 Tax=Didymella pomorum TaxID=749634 RepID=A0A9W8ZID9_9PLEO|nr:hypothetical protein N0V91_004477 [Didymella pomorum]